MTSHERERHAHHVHREATEPATVSSAEDQSVRAALHVHSIYSHDGADSLEGLRAQCAARGVSWLGLTDHAEDFDDDTFAAFTEQCATLSDSSIRLVPGLEYRLPGTRGIHILVLGATTLIRPSSADDFFARIGHTTAFTILAHPILCAYNPPPTVRASVDAIEVWNARYNSPKLPDPRAIELFRRMHEERPSLVATVGHDQHDGKDDAKTNTLIDGHMPLIDALRAGRYTSSGRGMSFDAHASLSPVEFRALERRRTLLDGAAGIGERLRRVAHRLGW